MAILAVQAMEVMTKISTLSRKLYNILMKM